MANGTVGVAQASSPDRLIDNESLTVAAQTVYRQRVQIAGTADTDIAPVSPTTGLLVNTEMPAAAALSDATANPTAPMVGGALMVWDSAGSQWVRAESGADNADGVAVSTTTNKQRVNARLMTFNGTGFDRVRNNVDAIVLASASRSTTQTGADTTNYNGRGIEIVLDMTSVASSPSVTLSVQGKDANGIYYTILTGAAVTTVSTNVYRIYPGILGVGNVAANDVLPRVYRIVVTANNANAGTYSVASSLLV